MGSRLVLWDVDFTLINAGGIGQHLYGLVFRDLFGRDMPGIAPVAGRTDRAIILDTLARAGVAEPRDHLEEFLAGMAARAPALSGLAGKRGRVLPGVTAALTALAGQVQSVLTGNMRALAELKLGALGLARHLDLAIGAYGDHDEDRAELVHLARGNAGRAYGRDFGGEATVLVGDTPLDVAAALATGARSVGVATGGSTRAELAAAGAHAVLPDLTDTPAVLAAVLGRSSAAEPARFHDRGESGGLPTHRDHG